jgi:hypothetical protein
MLGVVTPKNGMIIVVLRRSVKGAQCLPVNQDGERVFDESINMLLVVANESYDEFARSLQTEYEDDCGVTFGRCPGWRSASLLRNFSKFLVSRTR